MDEKSFLKTYNPKEFDAPIVCVDSVVFTFHEDRLKVLLVERANHPDKGLWGLPGGFVDIHSDKDIEDTAIRKLKEKTFVSPPYIEQLTSLGNALRDKRGWSITVCFTALIAHQECEAKMKDVVDAQWVEIDHIDELEIAFDHKSIIQLGIERLRQKALYSLVPAYALPDEFTLSQLQRIHEVLIGKSIQKKSFRRRIEQADILEEVGEVKMGRGRPAALFRMKQESSDFTFVRNLAQ